MTLLRKIRPQQITVYKNQKLTFQITRDKFYKHGIFFNSLRPDSSPLGNGSAIFIERQLCSGPCLGHSVSLDTSEFLIRTFLPAHHGIGHYSDHRYDHGDWKQHGKRIGNHGSNGIRAFQDTHKRSQRHYLSICCPFDRNRIGSTGICSRNHWHPVFLFHCNISKLVTVRFSTRIRRAFKIHATVRFSITRTSANNLRYVCKFY